MKASALAALLLLLPSVAASARPIDVVLVKRAGVTAYEEATEEFGERCRVRTRVITLDDTAAPPPVATLLAGCGGGAAGCLVIALGQEALDAVQGAHARIIPALAFALPPGPTGSPAAAPAGLVLRLLERARPRMRVVGTIYGPRTESTARAAAKVAAAEGLVIDARAVADGPAAVRALEALAQRSDALWLPADADVVTPQVFAYALALELERGLPLVGASIQQARAGALFAVDYAPRDAGRALAVLANQALAGAPARAPVLEPRVTINRGAARHLGIDWKRLEEPAVRP